jgi:hypothetical protein
MLIIDYQLYIKFVCNDNFAVVTLIARIDTPIKSSFAYFLGTTD